MGVDSFVLLRRLITIDPTNLDLAVNAFGQIKPSASFREEVGGFKTTEIDVLVCTP